MTQIPGEIYALLAAMTWAMALVLFKYSGERVSPLALNLFKCVVGTLMLIVTLVGARFIEPVVGDQSIAVLLARPQRDVWILVASGVIGIAMADTLFFYALNRIGVGILAIVDCLYSPFVILFAFVWLHEDLVAAHLKGLGLILAGVLLSSRHDPPANRTRRDLVIGVIVGGFAVSSMAFGIVIAKNTLEGFPLIWAAAIRLAAGTVALALVSPFLPECKGMWAVFKPSAAWKTAIPGALLGTYLAYVFWVAGFKLADASINAILNQTTVIFSIILATVIVREPLTKRKMVSVGLAVLGVAVVLFDKIGDLLGWG